MYILKNSTGEIAASSEAQYDGYEYTDKNVICGWNGRLYFEDDPRATMPPDVRLQQLADSVRAERDRRIAATDYLMAIDYPMTEAEREPWRAYRQSLRDIPAQPGFPWAGGGVDDADCPWPVKSGE